jgi:hypothetical protein
MRTGSRATPWVVFALWLATTAAAFWFFELRFQRTFTSSGVTLFESDAHLQEAADWMRKLVAAGAGEAGSIATVVHVARAECPCNRFTEPHLAQIAATYRERGVGFVRASGPMPAWIESTPAALVFDGSGRLVYFGPYSDSAWCGVSGGQVERALDDVLKGGTPRPQRLFAQGCFCGGKSP